MNSIAHRPIRSIGIYGSSSGRNAGDAALIAGIMEGIDQEFGTRLLYEIPTYRPDYIWYNYEPRTRPASMLPWHGSVGMFGVPTYRSFKRCDLNIVYDNMLFDKKLFNPLFNYMPAVWWYFTKQRESGQRLGMYNVGCGPVTTERGRCMLKEIADVCDFITVRDSDSRELLKEVGCTHQRILVTADAALTVQPAPKERVEQILKASGIEPGTELLAVNVNSYIGSWSGTKGGSVDAKTFVRIYGEALSALQEELKVPLVFCATQHSDVAITEMVRRAVRSIHKNYLITNQTYNHAEMKGVLGSMSFLFGMRLHANILGTSMTTPAVALSFQKKVSSYYKELNLAQNILSFDNFSKESIIKLVREGWNRRHEIRAHLQKRIPELQSRSLVAAAVVHSLSNGASGEASIEHGARLLAKLTEREAASAPLAAAV